MYTASWGTALVQLKGIIEKMLLPLVPIQVNEDDAFRVIDEVFQLSGFVAKLLCLHEVILQQ